MAQAPTHYIQQSCVIPKCDPRNIDKDVKLSCYVVKKDENLFRGRSQIREESIESGKWFALNATDASIYGYVGVYTTVKDLHLLNMDDHESYRIIGAAYKVWARENGKSIYSFESVFEMGHTGDILRTSDFAGDTNVISSFCSMIDLGCGQIDGWMTLPMKTIARESTHHAEVVLCTPSQCVTLKQNLLDLDYNEDRIRMLRDAKDAAQKKALTKKAPRRY